MLETVPSSSNKSLLSARVSSPSDSANDEPAHPITMEDISPLLFFKQFGKESNRANIQKDLFSDAADYVIQNQQRTTQRKLSRLNQGIDAIRERWPKASPLDIWVGFDLANCCCDDLLEKIAEPGFKQQVKNEVAHRLSRQSSQQSQPEEENDPDDDEAEEDSPDDCEFKLTCTPPPKKSAPKHKRAPKMPQTPPGVIPPCPEEIEPEEWNSWSDIHRKSYLCGINEQPNTFLYRNPPIGVKRKNGPWSEDEKKAFLKRLDELRGDRDTIDGQWGIFSLGVPGRVGYQCSNFYRLLIMSGELTDSRYVFGEDGKLHHTSHFHPGQPSASKSKKKRDSSRPVKEIPLKSVNTLHFFMSKHGKSNHSYNTTPSTSTTNETEEEQPTKVLSRYERWALQNPLPDAVDYLTNEVMKVPTISPNGTVLDYETWMKVLVKEAKDPLTMTHITKRELVVLTVENIDQYRDKIRNL